MNILEILIKSTKKMLWPRRFLPFFLLYVLFSLCALIFLFPIFQILPSLILFGFTKIQLAIVVVNISGLAIVFLIIILTNLWFAGALAHDVHKKKGFDFGLKQVQKRYWQILALGFVLFLFFIISSLLGDFSIIARIAIDWIFMFSLPAIIIKKDSFDLALRRSYSFVRKNILETFVFHLLTYFITFVILFVSLMLVVLSLFPLFQSIIDLLPLTVEMAKIQTIQMTYLILSNYPSLLIASIIFSFFLAISQVFIYTSRTYYFLELKKKKIKLY